MLGDTRYILSGNFWGNYIILSMLRLQNHIYIIYLIIFAVKNFLPD